MHGLALTLRSASMVPTILTGQTVWADVDRCPHTGDVVAFPRDGRTIVHRLVLTFRGPLGAFALERGDGRRYPRLLRKDAILGVVVLPDPGPSPSSRPAASELAWWLAGILRTRVRRLRAHLSPAGAIP